MGSLSEVSFVSLWCVKRAKVFKHCVQLTACVAKYHCTCHYTRLHHAKVLDAEARSLLQSDYPDRINFQLA